MANIRQTVDASGLTASSLQTLNHAAPIAVIAPHPDDESLGCGALLAACFATTGATVICMTDGRRSHPQSRLWPGHRLAHLRQRELVDAINTLGGNESDIRHLGYEDWATPTCGDDFEQAIEKISQWCVQSSVECVYTTCSLDEHADHKASAAIAQEVAVRSGLRLFQYPVWSRWLCAIDQYPSEHADTLPGVLHRFALEPWSEVKLAAVRAHRSQLGEVVRDDSSGFILPDAMVRLFITEDEYYIESLLG